MEAIVVYESVWGNTAAVARAIAEGIGGGTRAFPTDEVPPELLAAAELIVAGSPVFAFSLPSEGTRERILRSETEGRLRTCPTRRSDPGWMRCRPARAWPRPSRRASGGPREGPPARSRRSSPRPAIPAS